MIDRDSIAEVVKRRKEGLQSQTVLECENRFEKERVAQLGAEEYRPKEARIRNENKLQMQKRAQREREEKSSHGEMKGLYPPWDHLSSLAESASVY